MTDYMWMKDRITSSEQLRVTIEEPREAILKKTVNVVDEHIERYLQMSSLFFLGTSNADRLTDVSPRGGKAGFVKVLDDKHLAFPDRPGNKRVDSLLNIIQNPQVGMVFIIPGLSEVLRINGKAVITQNEEFIRSQGWEGATTGLSVVVEVEECFIHCPKAFIQGGVWSPESWAQKEEMPSTTDMYKAHLLLNGITL
ncbi:MSMEG_1061 family FMN-dependent PPOX-type flavoprotein [Paenibacillus sp. Marseille-Q4541]|uniref:MSMEG_1061 family FMN-dependent PPOX-type flavoprotein n=1 Tax=Paenibacillus sp. Marseille-Q4541 TaxID=2831522 RepID=UPI0020189C07|nr:MSMEG_1061 family FMN-dependent PPOX-type flavoprotein [Paenibacillus sp. Marseille-Q4541]